VICAGIFVGGFGARLAPKEGGEPAGHGGKL
jgi:hypothetical protein